MKVKDFEQFKLEVNKVLSARDTRINLKYKTTIKNELNLL